MLILPVTIMDKNIKGLILLALVLLWRKFLNIKAGKQASCLLWGLLILTCPPKSRVGQSVNQRSLNSILTESYSCWKHGV